MLQKSALRRIMVTSIALFIFGLLSFFPNKLEEDIPMSTIIEKPEKTAVYLLDKNGYVARVNAAIKKEDALSRAKEIIELLTIHSTKSQYITSGFEAILPSGTKLNNIALQDGILKLDFNETFLKIPKNKSEDAIESLIFSLTEMDEVKGILIYVNGQMLTTLPNTNRKLPDILTREYGINKIYDLTSFKNTTKTITYYASKNENTVYYVPVTEITNDEKDKVEIIIERLKSSPINQTNLISYLNANAELLDYEILENDVKLSFNKYLLDDFQNNQILEEVEYSIALSLKDTLNVSNVSFVVDGEKIIEINT